MKPRQVSEKFISQIVYDLLARRGEYHSLKVRKGERRYDGYHVFYTRLYDTRYVIRARRLQLAEQCPVSLNKLIPADKIVDDIAEQLGLIQLNPY